MYVPYCSRASVSDRPYAANVTLANHGDTLAQKARGSDKKRPMHEAHISFSNLGFEL